MDIGARIKEVRKAAGLTQGEFGARIHVSVSAVSSLEVGKNTPSEQTVHLICREFDVNKVWLLHGKGEMTSTGPFEPQLHKVLRRHPDLQAALELLVEDNDPEFWAALNTVAHKLVEQKKKKEAE